MATRRGTLALLVGGTLWALVMVAYLKTHGPGSFDFKRLLFGFSRDNYLLLLTPAALLIGFGLLSLRNTFLPLTTRLFSIASMGAIVLLGVFATGNLVLTTRVGVGEHPPWPNHDLVSTIGGVLQSVSLLPLGVCLVLMGVALWRRRHFRPGAIVLLVPLAVIALAPWQPIHGYPGVLFGVAWAGVGVLYAPAESRAAVDQ